MTKVEMTVLAVIYYELSFGQMKFITNLSNILFEEQIIISKRRQWNVTKFPLNTVKFWLFFSHNFSQLATATIKL